MTFLLEITDGEGPVHTLLDGHPNFRLLEPATVAHVRAGDKVQITIGYRPTSAKGQSTNFVAYQSAPGGEASVFKLPVKGATKQDNNMAVKVVDGDDYKVRENWTIDDFIKHHNSAVLSGFDNLGAALSNFETVLSQPSKKEAKQLAATTLAVNQASDLALKLVVKPLLKMVPVIGDSLYETFKAMLKVGAKTQSESRRAQQAATGNALKNMVVTVRDNAAAARAKWLSEGTGVGVVFRTAYESKSKVDRALFTAELDSQARGAFMAQRAGGRASSASLFRKMSAAWLAQSPQVDGRPNRLVVQVDKGWSLIGATLVAPRGDRLAEELLRLHGGNLNIRDLGAPIEVRWRYHSDRPGADGRATASAWLAPDGSLLEISPGAMVVNPTALKRAMRAKLAAHGVPEVTRLNGTP